MKLEDDEITKIYNEAYGNTEDGAERWATILHEALADILADADLYQVWQSV